MDSDGEHYVPDSDDEAGDSLCPAASGNDSPTQEELQQRRQQNIKAMLAGSLDLHRKPLLPRLLSVANVEVVLRQPFKSPHPNASSSCSELLRRKLLARRVFVPFGSKTPLPAREVLAPVPLPPRVEEEDYSAVEPLCLWEASPGDGGQVLVDPMLTKWLRPHQRQGVQFMFECVTGLRGFDGSGCILADDMGLGKTLQGITLLWTLLQSGHEALGGTPIAKRAIIVCPTSLVSNWDNECTKWLKGRVRTLPLCESSREDVIHSVGQFLSPRNLFQVLIVSYETFRIHSDRFKSATACDLLICDEAHRLKNNGNLTYKALNSLVCKRRVLLSGTPMQNHLEEFYSMVNFVNPGSLGTISEFSRRFESPIVAGREPGAAEAVVQLGMERSAELSNIVNQYILRRTNALLSAHLPPKVVEVVCCRLTTLQRDLYCHFLQSKAARLLLTDEKKKSGALPAITNLKKLCNHPKLIYDALHSHGCGGVPEGFEGCDKFFLPGVLDDGRVGRGGMARDWHALSGKFAVLAEMLDILYTKTKDRIVLVSNYTQTLDLFAVLCREKGYPYLRLDGTTTINKRQKLVKQFNDPNERQFAFLLSSKAGGCGLNLIGGNRLVLFDPDWNPANDKQAAARVWRDGQTKRVFVYRFLSTGSIEEKVYQRQLSKEGLQSVVNSTAGNSDGASGSASNAMSSEELRDLFTLRADVMSDTYSSVCGGEEEDEDQTASGMAKRQVLKAQEGAPNEEDLGSWGLHSSTATVPDDVLRRIGDEHISFVFSCQVDGKAVDEPDVGAPPATATPAPASSAAANAGASGTASRLHATALRQRALSASAAACMKASQPASSRPVAVTQRIPHRSAPAVPARRPLSPVSTNAVAADAAVSGSSKRPRSAKHSMALKQLAKSPPAGAAGGHCSDDDFK